MYSQSYFEPASKRMWWRKKNYEKFSWVNEPFIYQHIPLHTHTLIHPPFKWKIHESMNLYECWNEKLTSLCHYRNNMEIVFYSCLRNFPNFTIKLICIIMYSKHFLLTHSSLENFFIILSFLSSFHNKNLWMT